MWGTKLANRPLIGTALTGIGEQKYGDKPQTCPRTYFTVLLPQVGIPPKRRYQRLGYIPDHADFIRITAL